MRHSPKWIVKKIEKKIISLNCLCIEQFEAKVLAREMDLQRIRQTFKRLCYFTFMEFPRNSEPENIL